MCCLQNFKLDLDALQDAIEWKDYPQSESRYLQHI